MKLHTVLILLVLFLVAAGSAFGQSSVIGYQGRLSEASVVENGAYQFQFKLYDAAEGCNQIGSTIEVKTLVTNGAFSAGLDFGKEAFSGADRYLEISIRKNESEAYAP